MAPSAQFRLAKQARRSAARRLSAPFLARILVPGARPAGYSRIGGTSCPSSSRGSRAGRCSRRWQAVFASTVCPALAQAQDWPNRPVTIIVPYGPGASNDTFTRMLANILTKQFGQPFIVSNRPGAGGFIGSDAVAKAAPDGYTFLEMPSSIAGFKPIMKVDHRSGEESGAGRAAGAFARGHGDQRRAAGEDGQGVHRVRQGAPGHDVLRHGRHRHHQSPAGRDVQGGHRDQDDGRQLQERGRRPERPHRRTGAGDVHHHRELARAGRGRAVAAARLLRQQLSARNRSRRRRWPKPACRAWR